MSATNNIQASVDAGAITLEEDVPSATIRRDPLRRLTRSNLSGGIGPTRVATRPHTSISVNAGLGTVCLTLSVDVFIF